MKWNKIKIPIKYLIIDQLFSNIENNANNTDEFAIFLWSKRLHVRGSRISACPITLVNYSGELGHVRSALYQDKHE